MKAHHGAAAARTIPAAGDEDDGQDRRAHHANADPGPKEPTEAAAFVRDGHVALDGTVALSPNGGLIGEAYVHGMNLVTEAVRQIRGTATNQVRNVENVLLSAGMSGAILSKC